MSFIERILRAFPLPSQVAMPAVGIDISDRSIKLIELGARGDKRRVGRFATVEVPEGIVVDGRVARREELIAILSKIRVEHGVTSVRASLPEEPGYIFTTTVPDVSPDEIRSLLAFKLEEHVPLAPAEAVIDFDPIDAGGSQRIVAVSVYPETIARDYTDLLRAAGLSPLSLEIEAQAIARAVVPQGARGASMIVDVGAVRSGITVVGGGAVRFTTTVAGGGESLTASIRAALPHATEADILAIQNHEGLAHRSTAEVREAFDRFATELSQQIERYFVYWQTRKDAADAKLPEHPIEKIYLSGGYANIAGLTDRVARDVRVTVERANVWTNVLDVRNEIPPISYEDSLGYAAAVGLALHHDV